MQHLIGVSQRGGTVTIDDKFFTDCSFVGCTLIYTGADFDWKNTVWDDCDLLLAGPAQRTRGILEKFGYSLQKASHVVPPSSGVIQ